MSPSRLLPLLACASILGACAADPLKALRDEPPVPRAVAVRLHLHVAGDGCYGAQRQWEEDFVRVFEGLRVAAAVWGADREADADLLVEVRLRPSPPAEPEVDARGAFLDFLAWSTVPLVPLWIPDVNVSPGLRYEIERKLRSMDGAWQPAWEPAPREASAVITCFRERRPFLSWPTLGALFVPPFVFQGTDPEHFEASVAPRLREDVAVQAARVVKGSFLPERELLEDFRVARAGSAIVLAYRPLPALRKIKVTLEPAEPGLERSEEEVLPFEGSTPALRRLGIGRLLEGRSAPPRLVRIEAIGERGAPLRYTIPFPSGSTPSGSFPSRGGAP
ncbi:MAG: hypothetical protein HY721_11095 [Planctomycetes bacterium]|nr:hypothetical protein [Planctomycetota bacterium]